VRSLAFVTTTFPTLAAFLENEVHRLVARGVKVRVYTLRGVGTEHQPEHAALVPLVTPVGSPFDAGSWWLLLGWLARRPHVLVPAVARLVWASRGSLYALAGHLGYLPAAARIATLVEREDLEVVHGAWAHFPASVAWLAARLTGRRFTMAAHAGSDLYRTRAFLADKVREADFVTACVRGNAELLRELAGPGARVEWIYHGVDLSRFDGAGRARDPEPLFVVVGRLAVPKGFDLAVKALGALARGGRAGRLVVIGDGPERANLEALARAEGVHERVTFTGALTHHDILPYYRRAWALLAPCRVMANGRRDGIPNVVIEALAMGVPCVGTRAAGLEEAIEPGVNGALADPEDVEGLAAALAALVDDPARVDALGAEARRRALDGFDADTNFARLAALWDAGRRVRGAGRTA
jgi:colanic acid/amylovoran biosynthesis glycosyltransferase